jgi:hypothetical protein
VKERTPAVIKERETACKLLDLAEPLAVQCATDTYQALKIDVATCLEQYQLVKSDWGNRVTSGLFSTLEELARRALECQLALFQVFEVKYSVTGTWLVPWGMCEDRCLKLRMAHSTIVVVKQSATGGALDRQLIFSILQQLKQVLDEPEDASAAAE